MLHSYRPRPARTRRPNRKIDHTVFDSTSVWEPFCERIADVALLGNLVAMLADAAAPEPEPGPGQAKQAKAEPQPQHHQNQQFALSFALADLRAPPSAAVNDPLLRSHTPTTDLFLFSHVVRESAACEHDLLPAILRSCKRGAVLVFLDMQWADLHTIQELVTRVEAEDAAAVAAAAARPSTTRSEVMRVGESQEYIYTQCLGWCSASFHRNIRICPFCVVQLISRCSGTDTKS